MSWERCAAFDVLGEPKGQPRPRAFARNGKARVYDPATAEGWKGQVALAARNYLPQAPLQGPIKLFVQFRFPRPKRLQTRKSPKGYIPHTAKPDADNAIKAVMDTLTIVGFWHDDAQVVALETEKYYAPTGYMSGALIQVFAWRDAA